jgi:hypothetical protein
MPPPQRPPRSSRQCARCPGRPLVLRPCLSRHSKHPHTSRARSAAAIGQHCACNTNPASTRDRAASSRGTLRHPCLRGRLTVGFTSTANSARHGRGNVRLPAGHFKHSASCYSYSYSTSTWVRRCGRRASRTIDVATGQTKGTRECLVVDAWLTHKGRCHRVHKEEQVVGSRTQEVVA